MSDRPLCARGCTYDDGTPRLAVPGSEICSRDEQYLRDGLREVGTLYALLADPRRGQAPRTGGRGTERAQPLSDDARRARSDLRLALIQWCKILAEPEFGIGLPDERLIRARTVELLQGSDSDLAAASVHRDSDGMKRARAASAALRDDIATDADLQAGLAEHVGRQLIRLLASPEHAEEFTSEMLFLLSEARRLVYPGRRMTIACSCGSRVTVDPDRLMVCPGCDTGGDIAWWQGQATAEQDARPLRLRELPDWLLLRGLVVSYEQVRSWADDGHLHAALVAGPTADAPTATRTYDGPTAYLIADHRLNGARVATGS